MVRTLDELVDILLEARRGGAAVGQEAPDLDDEARRARGQELGEAYARGRAQGLLAVDVKALVARAFATGYLCQ